MSFSIRMYGTPCAVCGRPASEVGVVGHLRHIHHVQDRTRSCTVGNEPPKPQERQEAAA